MSDKPAAPKATEHLYTKTIAFVLGMFLAVIYAVLSFFTNPVLGIEALYNIALNTAFYAVVWTALIFISQLIWKYLHGLSDKLMKDTNVEHMGSKTIALIFGIFLAFIYTVLSFFTTPVSGIEHLYNIALVTAFFTLVWSLIIELAQIMWLWAHKLSDKIG